MRSLGGRRLGAATLAALTLVACVRSSGDDLPERPPSTVSFPGSAALLHVDVAATPDSRRQGLMGVEHLPPDQGMAFVFEGPVTSTFWMKDTPTPLSIAFVDDAGRIVTVRDMRPCSADPCPRYSSNAPYVLAIEANLGWFTRQDIGIGDRASLREQAYA